MAWLALLALAALAPACMGFLSPMTQQARASALHLSSRSAELSMSAGKALIVQNKGGGHGELGYHLANILQEKGVEVTLLQDSAAKKAKQPFASYGELESKGVKVVWGDFAGEGGVGASLPSDEAFDYVFDNYAKDPATAKDVAVAAKSWSVKNYVYVSSAGMYKNTEEVPLVETDAVKETGQRQVELMAEEMGLPWTSFRPQYIYGPLTNKRDYLDWFYDRVVWAMSPFPLPHHGDQFVAITHAEDVASMLAAVVGNPSAVGQIFNCASTRYITYNALAKSVAKACGQDPSDISHRYYKPADYGAEKGYFPFRENHFFVSSDKAVRLLGWQPKHDLLQDLEWYRDSYVAAGKADTPPDFLKDDEINIIDPEYVPWTVRRQLAEENPELEQQLTSIRDKMNELDKYYYSGMLEQLKEEHAQA
ncbi:hypothetical protein JKP88DRAFT_188667, partial [Tribonema minus]